MQPSTLNTLTIPATTTDTPATLVNARNIPLRVLVKNIGGVIVFLSHEVESLNLNGSSIGVYQLPAGDEDVFVLAPKQNLYAVASGGVGLLSVAASEALPIDFRG